MRPCRVTHSLGRRLPTGIDQTRSGQCQCLIPITLDPPHRCLSRRGNIGCRGSMLCHRRIGPKCKWASKFVRHHCRRRTGIRTPANTHLGPYRRRPRYKCCCMFGCRSCHSPACCQLCTRLRRCMAPSHKRLCRFGCRSCRRLRWRLANIHLHLGIPPNHTPGLHLRCKPACRTCHKLVPRPARKLRRSRMRPTHTVSCMTANRSCRTSRLRPQRKL